MKKVWEVIKRVVKELFNALTNLLCPILSVLSAFAQLVHLPKSVIKSLKDAEYWCFFVSGTKKSVDKIAESIDESIEDGKLNLEEIVGITEGVVNASNKIVKAVDKIKKEKREE